MHVARCAMVIAVTILLSAVVVATQQLYVLVHTHSRDRAFEAVQGTHTSNGCFFFFFSSFSMLP